MLKMWLLEFTTTDIYDQYGVKELNKSWRSPRRSLPLELTTSPDLEVFIIGRSYDPKEKFLFREFKMKD